ncbi:mechanosensitive ion channel family protein (plasmid) [Kovacikia minuta CCNUW1]|uniref:mechanosensitive ion channel family protein n=1 Tax=Kovacikia minuta TaxID=2931930 RepID=UPI001CCB300D|nr:mechanosensitive ion channel family protein [Kovacikia minuta]UBF30676.1 mechanosensitive ion channel family protein [Kovacikia minuta CCNUW1]
MKRLLTKRTHRQRIRLIPWFARIGLGMGTIALILILTAALPANSQAPDLPGFKLLQTDPTLWSVQNDSLSTAQVRLDGYPLFTIAAPMTVSKPVNKTSPSPTPLTQRVLGIEQTLEQIANSDFNPDQLTVESAIDQKAALPVISVNGQYLMTVTTLDAQLRGTDPETWATELREMIKNALLRAKQERQPAFLVRQGITGGIILLSVGLASAAIAYMQRKLRQQQAQLAAASQQKEQTALGLVEAEDASHIPTVSQLQQQQQRTVNNLKQRVLRLIQVGLWGGSIFILLGLFPYTRSLQVVVLSAPLKLVGIGLGVYVLIRLSDAAIDRLFNAVQTGYVQSLQASQRLALRISTVSRVLKSATAILIVGVGTLAGLAVIGVDLLPLLAGAGIVGLAISFASQNVIKDVINGFLVLLEDQYAVGDVIVVEAVGGFVENMNLRITQLRNDEGRLITIPNGEIRVVQNLSKDWSRVDLTIEVAFSTDPDQALAMLQTLGNEIYSDLHWRTKMLEQPEVLGIDRIDHKGLLIRMWIKTKPLQQWAVAREFRRRLNQTMFAKGVEIGIPQQEFHLGGALNGNL